MADGDEVTNGMVTFTVRLEEWWVCNECGSDFRKVVDAGEIADHNCTTLQYKAEQERRNLNRLLLYDWKYYQIQPWWRIILYSSFFGLIAASFCVTTVIQIDSADGEISDRTVDWLFLVVMPVTWSCITVMVGLFTILDNRSSADKIVEGSLRLKSGRWIHNLEAHEILFLTDRGKVKL